MGVPTITTDPMTVEEFYALTDTRPDEEKWELIEGEPILNAWPTRVHQRIALNIAAWLHRYASEHQVEWEVLPGLGVRISGRDLPVPDVLIRPGTPPRGDPRSRECDDVIVALEVLSPSTESRDLRWKRNAYTNLPSLTHYVVIAQDAVDVVVFARDDGFAERRLRSLDDVLELSSLGVSLPLAEIYRDTGLGGQ
jgi:Uma2 family endonuclease